MTSPRATVWVLGDQLDPRHPALADAHPSTHRLLVVESRAKLAQHHWHVQRAHLVITAMRRFVHERRAEGWQVDHRVAASLAAGLAAHRDEHRPAEVVAMEPASRDGLELLQRLDVRLVRSNQFLCHQYHHIPIFIVAQTHLGNPENRFNWFTQIHIECFYINFSRIAIGIWIALVKIIKQFFDRFTERPCLFFLDQ